MRPKHCQSKLQLRRPARQKHLLIRHNFSKGEYLDDAGHEIGISKTTASTALASTIAILRLKLEAPTALPAGGRHTLPN